jgi:hypothetical protein
MTARASTRWPSIGELWTFLAVGIPALAALLVPMPSVDLAYQLRAGASIVAGDGIPTVDTWTFTVAGTPWLDQQWGAQGILAAVFQVAGWTGLAILRAILIGMTFGLVLSALRAAWSLASVRAGGSAIASSARTATLIVLGSFVVAAPALALRPQLFAILLFAATLLILVQRATHPRRLWLIPLLAVAWANLHGSFPLVVVLIGLAWVDEVALLREPIPPGQAKRRLPVRLLGSTGLALIGAISAIATLVTPFGVDGWRYIENLARNPSIRSEVTEWQPPSPLDPAGFAFYVSLAIVIGVVLFRLRSDRYRPPARFVAPILLALVFGVLGVATGRGLAWWAIAAPVAMVRLQPGLRLLDVRLPGLPALRARTAREASAIEARRSPLNALVVVALFVAAIGLLPGWRPLGPAGVPVGVLTHAPQGVANDLRDLAAGRAALLMPPPRVWNPQAWGSWLEWAVPQVQVATDSRIELYPRDLWLAANQLATGSGEWLSILDQFGAYVVIVTAEQKGTLEPVLDASPTWRLRFEDADGSIYTRRD